MNASNQQVLICRHRYSGLQIPNAEPCYGGASFCWAFLPESPFLASQLREVKMFFSTVLNVDIITLQAEVCANKAPIWSTTSSHSLFLTKSEKFLFPIYTLCSPIFPSLSTAFYCYLSNTNERQYQQSLDLTLSLSFHHVNNNYILFGHLL